MPKWRSLICRERWEDYRNDFHCVDIHIIIPSTVHFGEADLFLAFHMILKRIFFTTAKLSIFYQTATNTQQKIYILFSFEKIG